MIMCATCKEKVEEEKEKIYFNGINKTFCSKECLEKYLKIEKEKEEKQFLFSTICRVFHLTYVIPKLAMEVKRLYNEGYSYKKISAILHYIYDVTGHYIASPTLFYVKEYAEQARYYYKEIEKREEQVIKMRNSESNKPKEHRIIKPNYDKKRNSGLKIDPSKV